MLNFLIPISLLNFETHLSQSDNILIVEKTKNCFDLGELIPSNTKNLVKNYANLTVALWGVCSQSTFRFAKESHFGVVTIASGDMLFQADDEACFNDTDNDLQDRPDRCTESDSLIIDKAD
ncbi:hypothetical protein BY458DRAFT_490310 [Sporodiniella umbellata]|nr:hypothetical protein BY458DRAFT_490310 [Sporodiniella umbellata]